MQREDVFRWHFDYLLAGADAETINNVVSDVMLALIGSIEAAGKLETLEPLPDLAMWIAHAFDVPSVCFTDEEKRDFRAALMRAFPDMLREQEGEHG